MGAPMRYQPQGRVRLDAGNPLTRGLVTYMPLTGKSYFDVADGSTWAVSAGTSPVAYDGAPRGLGLRVKGATAAYITRPIPAAITSSVTQPLTIRYRLYFHSLATSHSIMSWASIPNDGSPRFYARTNAASQLNFFFSGGYNYTTPVVTEREYIVTHAFNGVQHLTYLNGVLIGSASNPWSANSASLYLGTGFDGQNTSSDFLLSDFALWNRALSAQEVASDAQNPWQLSQSANEDEDELAAAGSGATATPQGVTALASAGAVTAAGGAKAAPSGVTVSAAVGAASASIATTATASGISATAVIGTASARGNATVTSAGVSASGAVGIATASGTGAAFAAPVGVSASAVTGTPSASGSASIIVTGIAAAARVGSASASGGAASVPFVPPSRTVIFGGGTNRVDFDGGTNRVNF